jgi:hypothetical protein
MNSSCPDDPIPRFSSLSDALRLYHPTCEDLGIPLTDYNHDNCVISGSELTYQAIFSENSIFKPHEMTKNVKYHNDPFSYWCRVPWPNQLAAYEYGCELAFIRRRKKRERKRIHCVNEGYRKLREHLPCEVKNDKMSKVDTLRHAIKYIECLQNMVHNLDGRTQNNVNVTTNNTINNTKRELHDDKSAESLLNKASRQL